MLTNIKNFFEPTKEKLKIFVLIFLFATFLRGILREIAFEFKFIEVLVKIIEKILTFPLPLEKYIIPYYPPPSYRPPPGVKYDIVIYPFNTLLLLGINMIYWYFLSCFIVFIHKRLWSTPKSTQK